MNAGKTIVLSITLLCALCSLASSQSMDSVAGPEPWSAVRSQIAQMISDTFDIQNPQVTGLNGSPIKTVYQFSDYKNIEPKYYLPEGGIVEISKGGLGAFVIALYQYEGDSGIQEGYVRCSLSREDTSSAWTIWRIDLDDEPISLLTPDPDFYKIKGVIEAAVVDSLNGSKIDFYGWHGGAPDVRESSYGDNEQLYLWDNRGYVGARYSNSGLRLRIDLMFNGQIDGKYESSYISCELVRSDLLSNWQVRSIKVDSLPYNLIIRKKSKSYR